MMNETKLTLPEIVSRKEWLKQRKKLLKEEKELTRRRDKLIAQRRRLPMVEIEKDYEFEGPDLPAPRPKPGEFCMYVLKCSDGSFYKGQTDNFPKRLLEHEAKQVSWTASRLPVEPVHWEIFATREKAVKREKELKTGFGRKWLERQYEKGTLAAASRQAGGEVSLLDLFEGRRQLIIYHFMWLWKNGEPLDKGCPACTAGADEVSGGLLEHLHARDTSLAYISRGPLEKIEAYKAQRGWTFPFYSSYGSDFNYDFHVSFDESVAPFEYNYLTKAEIEERGFPVDKWEQPFDLHGHSCFLRDNDRVFHTYSTYARGAEQLGGSYYWLDMTALGRQENWEEPKDRVVNKRGANPNFAD